MNSHLFEHEHAYGRSQADRDGFVWAPYTPLQSTQSVMSESFYLGNCSLIEYIGVDWCNKIPDKDKIAYITEVFDALALAGNDNAAKDTLQLLKEIHESTEFYRRCIALRSLTEKCDAYYPWFKDLKHPYYPTERMVEVVEKELRHELLEFICARFWVIPLWWTMHGWNTQKTPVLAESRKKMIAVCAENWQGMPHEKTDISAFMMLCEMARPTHQGVCPIGRRNACETVKEFVDAVQQELRVVLRKVALAKEETFNWKYWMTLHPHPEQAEAVLDVFAKTRAALGGYKCALADILAREQVDALTDQVS